MSDHRSRTVMMARIKNESRWIVDCLRSAFAVCETVVLLDDGSTDGTGAVIYDQLFQASSHAMNPGFLGWRAETLPGEPRRQVYFLQSPYTDCVRPEERVNEIRDKNYLWYFVKARLVFDYVLCLDGDEVLSKEAIRRFPTAWEALDAHLDMVQLPFVYLWNSPGLQRVDGVYGAAERAGWHAQVTAADADPFQKALRFPRLFTIQRMSERSLFDMRFHWVGTRGGFHCGSIPQEGFNYGTGSDGHVIPPITGFLEMPVIHYGYLDDSMRRTKHAFYNALDPDNVFEGRYAHCIGEPDGLAPGPVTLMPYEDA